MADSLLTADKGQLENIAEVFAKTFIAESKASAKAGSSGVQMTPEERKKKQANKEYITTTKAASDELKKFGGHLKETGKGLLRTAERYFTFGRALKQASEDIRSGLRTGVEAGSFYIQQEAAMMMGTTVKDLNELNKATRLTTITMGGYESWTNQLRAQHKEYFFRIGDTTEATKFLGNTVKQFADSGITPTLEMLTETSEGQGRYGKSLKTSMDNLYKLGISYTEQSEILKEVTLDEDVRNRLRGAADESQRKAIIQGTMARFQEFRQLGMNVEQIKKANKALETMSGKGPMDRFEQAAKAQAALSAMGIEGADKVAAFLRAGDRATDAQRAEAAAIMGRAQDTIAESRQGGLGREFAFDAIMVQSGMQDLLGKSGPFSTKLDATKKVTDKQLETLETMATSSKGIDTLLRNTSYWEQIIKNAINNSALAIFAGAGAIALFKAGSWIARFFSRNKGIPLGDKSKKRTTTPAGGTTPDKTPDKPKDAKEKNLKKVNKLRKLLKLGKGVGLATALAGGAAAGALLPIIAAIAAEEAVMGAVTGESMIHDMMPQSVSDSFGKTGHKLAGAFGFGMGDLDEEQKKRLEEDRKRQEREKKKIKERLEREKREAKKDTITPNDLFVGTKQGVSDLEKKTTESNDILARILELQKLQAEMMMEKSGGETSQAIKDKWDNFQSTAQMGEAVPTHST